MSLAQQLQDIKKQYQDDMEKSRQKERRKERQYHVTLANHIVKAIMQKRVIGSNHIEVYMRLDDYRPLCAVEVNALLAEHYVKVRNITVHSTEFNSCMMNPAGCCCCPCIFFPKAIINGIFGTMHHIDVYLDV